MDIYSFKDLKFTLKHLKRSYMFRSYDHPQGAYTVRAIRRTTHIHSQAHSEQYRLAQYTRHAATAQTQRKDVND